MEHPAITPPTPNPPPPRGKGQRFTKVYNRGWQTLAQIATNQTALKVYMFLAEHCDHLNAVVCPIEVLTEELGYSKSTIMRATKFLADGKHLTIIKVGTANAYVLDPRDIWKNYDEYKRYCAFGATTLISKAQNRDLKTRLTMMMEGQGDLFGEKHDPATGEVN